MIAVKGSSCIDAGTRNTCGNCKSFMRVPDVLPFVDGESGTLGADGETIQCPQCCTSWLITSSDTREATVSLSCLQNEHRYGRSNHLANYRAQVDAGDAESDPELDRVAGTLRAIEEAERAHAEACAAALQHYSLRELAAATGVPRATLARRAKAGAQYVMPAEVNEQAEVAF